MTVYGILLAAGHGSRFDPSGRRSKLEARVEGEPVALRACRALVAGCDRVFAVCRADQSELAGILRGAGAVVVEIAAESLRDGAEGMGTSLATGARRVAAEAVPGDRVLVLPADMPWVDGATIRAIGAASAPADAIVVPTLADGSPDGSTPAPSPPTPATGGGHPVSFPAALLPELAGLAGDRGARDLLRRHPVRRLVVTDAGIVRDVDRPSDLGPDGDTPAPRAAR